MGHKMRLNPVQATDGWEIEKGTLAPDGDRFAVPDWKALGYPSLVGPFNSRVDAIAAIRALPVAK